MKRTKFFVLFCFIYFFVAIPVRAEYVLPYPSYMPGNKLYKVSKIIEIFEKWWYWGSISQTKYYMQLADKYLVEAKTLFEYKQYLLALEALHKSDMYINKVPFFIHKAQGEQKDISELELSYKAELAVQREALQKLVSELPVEFTWTPE